MRPILVAVLLLALGGCGTYGKSINPVDAAQRPETVGLALFGSFTIAEERVADLVENPAVPHNVQQSLIRLDAVASPIAEKLPPAIVMVQGVRAELDACISAAAGPCNQQERLELAVKSLNGWITQAAPLINDLINAVIGAKP